MGSNEGNDMSFSATKIYAKILESSNGWGAWPQ